MQRLLPFFAGEGLGAQRPWPGRFAGDLSQDVEADFPQVARDFKQAIADVDGVLIATPEYSRSIPGVLKNAFDWSTRPYGEMSFSGKPVAIISYTTKGQGVDYMEAAPGAWHIGGLSKDKLEETYEIIDAYTTRKLEEVK